MHAGPRTNLEKVCIASPALELEPDVMKCRDLSNTKTTPDKNLSMFSNCRPVNERSSSWHIPEFVTRFRELWEPGVYEGKVRVRWKCVSTYEVPGRHNTNLSTEMWPVFV